MSWVIASLLALAAFGLAAFVLKAPRQGWEAIGAALLLGIAGYGLQGSPNVPGAPKAAAETISGDPAALVEARNAVSGKKGVPENNLVLVGDALARHGQFADAASVLQGAVAKDPRNGEAWLALANALVSHSDGLLTPAALYAFRHAEDASPDNPGPPFFLGLALAQTGRFAEAKQLWQDLLKRSPPDAPWRADLESRLARLDEFVAAREQAPPVQ